MDGTEPEILANEVGSSVEVPTRAASLFREAELYRALREHVVPWLRTFPSVNVWCAGCGSGLEAYAAAIVLKEEGLLRRSCVWATDVSEDALAQAREGVYSLDVLREDDYRAAGGTGKLADHISMSGNRAALAPELRKRVAFAQHSLESDASFHEFQLVLCRNVIGGLDAGLRARAFELLHESLCPFGALGLGRKESIGPNPYAGFYERLDPSEALYRRVERVDYRLEREARVEGR